MRRSSRSAGWFFLKSLLRACPEAELHGLRSMAAGGEWATYLISLSRYCSRGPRSVRKNGAAAETARLRPVAGAPADDNDQEVLVNPGDLGARQAALERRDGRAQLLRRVERDRGVVVRFGLGTEPLGRA
jgi:hypothetical protein